MRLLLCTLLFLLAAPSRADEARPLYIEAKVAANQSLDFIWRIPPNFAPATAPDLVLPGDCRQLGTARNRSDGVGHWRHARWLCRKALAGRSFLIDYPQGNPNLATIFKLEDARGIATAAVFLPGVARIDLPAPEDRVSNNPFRDYLLLGIEHIWLGLDHLLFVACLIWIAGTAKRILATITGFTAAHSVTLALAALDLVEVPIRTIEVLIAVSIALLAVELARNQRTTITWRHPVAVSTCFGLLHGFGFAAVLGEIGLPREGLLTALLAFNVGIEIGQLIFAAALILMSQVVAATAGMLTSPRAAKRAFVTLPDRPRLVVAYAVGVTSTFWILERMS